jgi:hypothetical protein
MRRVRVTAAVSALGAAVLTLAGIASATGAAATASYQVVADHLNNPRQLAVQDGAVYVAEAGTGGTGCTSGQPCIGFSGSVTRVGHGHAVRVQTGLLSVSVPEGAGEVVGVDALAFRHGDLYGVATGACQLTGAPAPVLAQAGKVLKLQGGTAFQAVGDPGAFECAKNPDGQEKDTDPYGLVATRDGFFVADAAGNDVVSVRHGRVSVATVLSTTGQPVPTSLAIGPDGALYIGTLNFEGGPGGAKVYRLAPGARQATVYAAGFTAITAIAFGEHGRLYVTEFTTSLTQNGPGPDGDVVVVPWGGGSAGRSVIGAGVLHFPGGVAVVGHDVYVSNNSTSSGPNGHGQLVRFSDRH